jgi:hypothetical protein
MVLFRALGWLLLVMTVATAVQNGLTWWSEGAFRFLTLGDVWAHLDYGSMSAVQGYLSEHVSAHGWSWGVMPLLHLPALPVFLVLGLFCLWIGQSGGDARRSGGRPSGFAVGSRRPRRRRSRGIS